ncbi:MAG: thiamine biosynthesis protein ThiS [Myxococcales bacterium]|nr:thiamine biosynthesis protein ThiS [Myxococcales bacterium]
MSHPITIVVNGVEQDAEADWTLLDLLAALDIDPELGGVAVAVGLKVVPRSAWASTRLNPSDEVEIIRATAGG